MKKILLLLLLPALCLGTASAQRKGFGAGFKVGLNVSNLHYSADKIALELQSQVGLTGGVFADYVFSSYFALSADVLYSKQGLKWTGTRTVDNLTSEQHEMDMDLHYLDVPVLFGYYPVEGLGIKVGLQPSFLLKDRTKYIIETHRNGGVTNTDEQELREHYKKFDLVIPLGASYLFPFGLIIDARYHFGLTNISQQSGTRIRNNYFSFTAGYRF